MKLWRVTYPGETPKLVSLDKEDGPLCELSLGETGRGRRNVVIPIMGNSGENVRVKVTRDTGYVIVRGDWPEKDDRCLAIINTVGSYDRYQKYGIFDASGVKELISGQYAFGAAGRVNGGPETLALVEPDAEFRLNNKYSSTWYRWTGREWVVESPSERKARLALEAVKVGEGEWL